MSRYIDADKLWNDRPQLLGGESIGFKAGFSECMWGFSKLIKEQISHPTADVVEVVRCLDCQWCEQVEGKKNVWSCYCRRFRHSREVDVNDYCSYGERKENGT